MFLRNADSLKTLEGVKQMRRNPNRSPFETHKIRMAVQRAIMKKVRRNRLKTALLKDRACYLSHSTLQ